MIRVMCSGRVDLGFVLRAFANGIDGVFIGACHLNECNYITHGNYHARNMVLLCRKIMARMGLNPERLRIAFMSGAEANVFVAAVNDFVRTIKSLGPLGRGEGLDEQELKAHLQAAGRLVPYIKMAKREKLETRLDDAADSDGFFSAEEVEALFRDVVSYHIDPQKCQACMICQRRCPAEAIAGGKNRIHVIDQEKCINCGTCLEACPPRFGAVERISGRPVPAPIPEEKRIIARKGKES